MPPQAVSSKTGNFVQPISTVLSNQSSSNTIEINNKAAQTYSKKKIILFIFIILFLIILIPIVALFIRNNNIERLAYLPSYLPSGFVSIADPLLQNLDGQESVVIGFANQDRNLLTISQYSQPDFNCSTLKPRIGSRVAGEYKVITFDEGKEGCFITTYGKDRYFDWKINETRVMIHAPKNVVTDDELIKIANSLTLQKIKVITKLPSK